MMQPSTSSRWKTDFDRKSITKDDGRKNIEGRWLLLSSLLAAEKPRPAGVSERVIFFRDGFYNEKEKPWPQEQWTWRLSMMR
jgi:hypothetical protein